MTRGIVVGYVHLKQSDAHSGGSQISLYQIEPAYKAIDVPRSLIYRFRWLHISGLNRKDER